MKKNLIIAAIAALAFSFTACQKEDPVNSNEEPIAPTRVKTTADLRNTDWTYSVTFTEFLGELFGLDTSYLQGMENDTLAFGLSFDTTYAHFSFPDNVGAYYLDDSLRQIYGISYSYAYDGTTHTGYLNGMTKDSNGKDVPAKLNFTYNDTTDAISFVLPLYYVEDNTPLNYTLIFKRNE